jgi:hypothetical protein
MESMPQETLKEIFDFLDPIDLFSVAMVCKAWNKISRDDKIWMKYAPPKYSTTSSLVLNITAGNQT